MVVEYNRLAEKAMQAQGMLKRIITNQYFRTYTTLALYVLLYFVYANNDHSEPNARTFGWLININASVLVITQMILMLSWYFEARSTPQKMFFFSFAMFCLLRLLYRAYVLIIDGSLVSTTPVWFMMIAIVIVLLAIESKYGSNKI